MCSQSQNPYLEAWVASLLPWWVASHWAAGWAMATLQGPPRNSSLIWPAHTKRLCTPLLRLHVSTLRLRQDALFPQQRKEAASLRLLKG